MARAMSRGRGREFRDLRRVRAGRCRCACQSAAVCAPRAIVCAYKSRSVRLSPPPMFGHTADDGAIGRERRSISGR
eukprot:6740198-Prymnesium_polylepis.1